MLAFIPSPPINGVHLGPLYFHFYGLCIALGILAGLWLARRRWRERGHDPAELDAPIFWGVVAGFVGGRIGYLNTHLGNYRTDWIHVFYVWQGGLALYGGLTLGIATGILVARRRRLPLAEAFDAVVPAIPLAQAFGRWGNYFNQELFGTPSRWPWALEISAAHRPAQYAAYSTFQPAFLYESVLDLLIVVALLRIDRTRRLRPGSLPLIYLFLYALGRFFLELVRVDTTFRILGLSRNGWISVGVVLGSGIWLYLRERNRPARGADEPGSSGAADDAAAASGPAVSSAHPPDGAQSDEPVVAPTAGRPPGQRGAADEGDRPAGRS